VLGAGVIGRIVRGYTFISRVYDPGDSVHIAGFSRGAYTARALAGMIATVGLLNKNAYDPNDKNKAYLMGLEAWMKCKSVVFTGKHGLAATLTNWAHAIGGAIARLTIKDKEFITGVRLKSVAVWDTVGSLGIPDYIAKGERRDLFSFVDLNLSPMIDRGFHAMALDERRLDFPVTRWNADARIEQVWFAGCHSDVGGGYPNAEAGLSDIALNWVMTKLASVGVQFAAPPAHAPVLTGFAQPYHTPWKKPPFNLGPKARKPLPDDAFDPSVRQRWDGSPDYQKDWPKLF
jgi:glutathione S-transferase